MHAVTHPTPAGPLSAIVDDDGTVRAAGFAPDASTLAARMGLAETPPTAGPDHPAVASLTRAVAAYLDGDAAAFDALPVAQDGTDFQQAVWAALRAIPAGTTASYGELAAAVGRPGATRAVGSACGRNLVAPLVPCHRAVRADGGRGGYLYGPAVKDWLLAHESGYR